MSLPDQGRMAKPVYILSMQEIAKEELGQLLRKRDNSLSMPKRLRHSHHVVARLLARGLEYDQIAEITAYSRSRIAQLAVSPAMQEQVAIYRTENLTRFDESVDHFAQTAINNMTAAERMLADHIAEADEADELLPMRELRAIVADRADRFGYGKHTTQTNVNVDFASKLEQAYARSRQVSQPPSQLTPVAKLGPRQSSLDQPRDVAPTPIRRIG